MPNKKNKTFFFGKVMIGSFYTKQVIFFCHDSYFLTPENLFNISPFSDYYIIFSKQHSPPLPPKTEEKTRSPNKTIWGNFGGPGPAGTLFGCQIGTPGRWRLRRLRRLRRLVRFACFFFLMSPQVDLFC